MVYLTVGHIMSFRGLTFVRTVIALAQASGSTRSALTIAQNNWGHGSQVVHLLKAAIAAGNTTDSAWAGNLVESSNAQMEFLEVVRPMTIVGKLPNLRRVPLRVPVAAQSSAATAYWVGEAGVKPLTSAAFNRERLDPTKVAAMVVCSDELLRFGQDAETTLRDDLAAATALAMDAAFIDRGNSGSAGVRPASVTNGALSINSTGTSTAAITHDIEAAIAAFQGDLGSAYWVLHPRTATAIGLKFAGGGIASDLGARGGVLAGLPAITSAAVPYGSTGSSMTLLDPASILFSEGGIEADRATQAAVVMNDAPGTGAAQQVSLWQTNSVAILVERETNWKAARSGSVVTIDGLEL